MKPNGSVVILLIYFLWMPFFTTAQQLALKDLPLDSLMSWLSDNFAVTDHFYYDANLALRKALQEKDNAAIANCHALLSKWHYSATYRNKDSILYHEKQGLHHNILTQDKENIAVAYVNYGTFLKDLGKYKEGETQLMKAVAIYKALGNQAGIANCYRRLCDFARNVSDFKEAIRYGELAVKMHRENGSSLEAQMNPLLCLMTAYNEAGQPLKAIEQANLLLDARKKGLIEDDLHDKIYIYYQRALAYTALQRYELAITDHETILQLDTSYHRKDAEEGPFHEDIANIAYLKKDYTAAISSFLKHIKYEQAQGNEETIIGARLKLADCYAQTGNPVEAYQQTVQAMDLQKRIYENKLAAIRTELRDKYQADEKEETIQQQQFRLRQQQTIQWFSLGIAGLLALLLAGLFLTYRNNHHRSLQLQALNEELAQTNVQLDRRNLQNEILLKEIHHRVKNNLEMVSSLLLLQSRQVNDPSARAVMEEGQNRVQSIGIVHQKLYQGDNLLSIEMKDYFVNLSEGILDTFNAEDRIQIECIMDKLELDVDTAVPIGLIVNELLTNALKYAFPNGQSGKVKIQLESTGDNYLRLEVADNGIGKMTQTKGTGFGSQLIALLTQQLGGTLQEELKNGTVVRLEFRKSSVA